MGRRNILLALCALKNIVFVVEIIIMLQQLIAKNISAALRSEKKYFDSEKTIAPPSSLRSSHLTSYVCTRFMGIC